MKVALVSPYALNVFGGVQGQVIGLARALGATDDVILVAPGCSGVEAGLATVDVGSTTSVPVNGSRAPVALTPGAWTRTRNGIERFSPDVVHVHEPFVPAVGLAALHSGRPIVATFHRSGVGAGYRALGRLLGGLAGRIRAASAVSEDAASTIRAVLGRKVGPLEILPNGVDVKRFASAPEIDRQRPRILFVGRLERRKGLAVLLEAFASVEGDVELDVIGSGPEERTLRAKAANDARVTFLGALGDHEKERWLTSADLFVAPSLGGESFGVVLLEAMAAGSPVLASGLPGYRLAAGDAAEFVPADDALALARAIRLLLADHGRRSELVALGRVRAAEYSFVALAERYRAVYAGAIDVSNAGWGSGRR